MQTIKQYAESHAPIEVDHVRAVINMFGIVSTGFGEKGKAPTPPKTYNPQDIDEALAAIAQFKATRS